MIAIVDYGMGNLGAIRNMLRRIGADSKTTSDPSIIEAADKVILPGVGAFDHAVRNLRDRGLWDVLDRVARGGTRPVLGICLGAQLLTCWSEEGELPGFGWLDAETVKFRQERAGTTLRIPHMGWNTVVQTRTHPLFEGMYEEPRFYFVHSYHLVCREPGDVVATTDYGFRFVSVVSRGNVHGTQFHPEKSHKFGMKLMENFAKM